MLNIGGAELLIILLVALIFLGPQRLPDVARQLGQTMSSLRSLASGFQAEIEAATKTATDASMTLTGPIDKDEAIAATQDEAVASRFTEPFKLVDTDPFAVKQAALDMDHDETVVKKVSAGGPGVVRNTASDAPAADAPDPDATDGDEEE